MKLWLRGVDLNHRPLGYEPNELPGCSTPQIQYISAFTHGQTREFATVCWLSHHQQTFLRMTRLPVVGIRFPTPTAVRRLQDQPCHLSENIGAITLS